MNKNVQRALKITARILRVAGIYCFIVLFLFRTDTTEDIFFKRNAAICFVFIWPVVFALSRAAREDAKESWLAQRFSRSTALVMETLIVLLLSYTIAFLLMTLEYSRLSSPEKIRGPFGI